MELILQFLLKIKKVVLNIYKSGSDLLPKEKIVLDPSINKTGDIWHIFLQNGSEGTLYTWKIDDYPEILDPYALSYTNNKNYSNRKSIAIKLSHEKEKHLEIPMQDTIIYEAHIKLFTQNFNSMVAVYRDILWFFRKDSLFKRFRSYSC